MLSRCNYIDQYARALSSAPRDFGDYPVLITKKLTSLLYANNPYLLEPEPDGPKAHREE